MSNLLKLICRVSLLSILISLFASGNAGAQFGADLGVRGGAVTLDRDDGELQESLIWTGHYNGLVDGVIGERTKTAIRNFQISLGATPTGVLTDNEYMTLVEDASRIRSGYGWTTFRHPDVGYSVSYPANSFENSSPLPNGGRRFSSRDTRLMLEIEIVEVAPNINLDKLYQKLSVRTSERYITYKRRTGNWFVLSGRFKDTAFYTKVEENNKNLIGYTFRWPVEESHKFENVSLAIANSFQAPADLQIPKSQELEQQEVIQSHPSNESFVDVAEPTPLILPPANEQMASLDPTDLFSNVKNAVWMVIAAPMRAGEPDLENASQGSAVAISHQHLLTNCHTLEDTDVIVLLRRDPNEIVLPARVVSGDYETDRCILSTPRADLESFVPIRASSDVEVGERVYSIGAPSGLDLTIGEGLLSGKRVDDEVLYLQNSAPISPGSSGGGLFDSRGNLIGITTFLLRDAQNLNFAISADEFEGLRKIY